MTSKEYLINCHVLLKHFKLVFIQLQLVKISCKLLVIWVNYEKNKKGSFFMKHRVVIIVTATTMFMVLSWHSHCESLLGSLAQMPRDCQSLSAWATGVPKLAAVEQHLPLLVITTRLEIWYSFTVLRRLEGWVIAVDWMNVLAIQVGRTSMQSWWKRWPANIQMTGL